MGNIKRKVKCKLPHYDVQEVLTLDEVRQKLGWNITAFNLPDVWKYTEGDGVKIAIIDSGCDLNHDDLKQNLLPGINIINPAEPPEDMCEHGTHCAGTIGAVNNAIGMVGVAPKAKIIPIKVLDGQGTGSFSDVAKGIRWAIDVGQADIISMSLGSPRPLANVRKAIQYADSKGVPVFVAAGNAGITRELYYPANYPETIAVGSIDENFDRSKFSNTGDRLDFMAPGGKIFSTVPKNWYAYLSGTSMACPFVVGVAALCLAYQRKNNPNKPLRGASDYREIFRKHTTPISNPDYANKKFFQGFGIIDTRDFKKWIDLSL